jgi:hypothetical protein
VLAVATGLVLVQRAVMLADIVAMRAEPVAGGVPFGVALPPTVVQLVGLTAVGAALVAVGVRSLRRLPDVRAPAPAG